MNETPAPRQVKIKYKDWTIQIKRRTNRTWSRKKYVNFDVSVYEPDGSGYDIIGSFTNIPDAEREGKKQVDYEILKNSNQETDDSPGAEHAPIFGGQF